MSNVLHTYLSCKPVHPKCLSAKEKAVPRILSEIDVADFRERLCDVATRLFSERGPDGFTMRELTAEMGVSAMTPYRYFRDKDEILAAVRARAFSRFADRLEAGLANGKDARSKARAVSEAYINFAFSEPSSYRLMFDLSQPNEKNYPMLVAANKRARACMTDYVRAMIDEKIFSGDADLLGHIFWAALHGAVVLELAGKFAPGYDFEKVRGECFRALTRGFAAKDTR
jgi:AcrR family transcriptional regulator